MLHDLNSDSNIISCPLQVLSYCSFRTFFICIQTKMFELCLPLVTSMIDIQTTIWIYIT